MKEQKQVMGPQGSKQDKWQTDNKAATAQEHRSRSPDNKHGNEVSCADNAFPLAPLGYHKELLYPDLTTYLRQW